MNFRKRAKIMPGVYLNLSKSGISTTIGPKGLNVNFGKNGTYLNTGIPGTGLYDRQRLDTPKGNKITYEEGNYHPTEHIRSKDAHTLTSSNLKDVKDALVECSIQRVNLKSEIYWRSILPVLSYIYLGLSYLFIFGFYVKHPKEFVEKSKANLKSAKEDLKNCKIEINENIPENVFKKYNLLIQEFKTLIKSDFKWDITSQTSTNQFRERTTATFTVEKRKAVIKFKELPIIKSETKPMVFITSQGTETYLYPTFVLVKSFNGFGIVDYKDLKFEYSSTRFNEEDVRPKDSNIEGYTWHKANKNGGPDKRFADNYQIPVYRYGEIKFNTSKGLNQFFMISNNNATTYFGSAFNKFYDSVLDPLYI